MELWRAREAMRGDAVFQAAFAEAWRRGRAHAFVLDLGQQAWLQRRESRPDFSVWMISRQRGKSFAAIFDDLMFAQRTPGAICRYLGQTGDSALSILGPTLNQIYALCPLPKSERPYPFNKLDSLGSSSDFHWENGATLVWSGTDNDTFRRQRGPKSHRITYDEAAFYPRLREVTETLNPTLTRSGGSPLYLSTPPVTPDHMFVELYESASAIGRSEHETLYQNPQLTPEQIERVISKAAMERNESVEKFKKSTYFRREFLAEICLDTELAVVPEFPEVRGEPVQPATEPPTYAAPSIIVSRERPPFYDVYVSGDPGMDDLTGMLFAITDFRRAKLVIEHELLLTKANTGTIAAELLAVLEAHYGAQVVKEKGVRQLADGSPKPYQIVFDDSSKRITADLWSYHRISASPAMKDDSEAAINVMRLEVGGLNVEINPRCVHLIRQLGNATRVKPGGDMARSRRDGHFDLVAALKYLCRHWDKRHNPFPLDYGYDPKTQTRREAPKTQSLGDVVLRGTSLARRR